MMIVLFRFAILGFPGVSKTLKRWINRLTNLRNKKSQKSEKTACAALLRIWLPPGRSPSLQKKARPKIKINWGKPLQKTLKVNKKSKEYPLRFSSRL